jgi:hypothetical protein
MVKPSVPKIVFFEPEPSPVEELRMDKFDIN